MIFINIILPIFLIIATGFLFEKIKKPDFKSISDFTLYFLTPCLIFKGLVETKLNLTTFLPKAILFMLILTVTLWILTTITSKVLKFNQLETAACSLSTIMMNTGNFGIPLILFAFGEKGLAYAIIVLVLFTFPLGTLAVFIASKGKSDIKTSIIEIFKIPLFHSIIAASIVRYFNINIPELIMKPIVLIGDAAIPALLMLLGMQLARTKITESIKPVFSSVFLRLIISPVIAIVLCKLLNITGLPAKVLIIQTSTPSAIIPLLYAVNYDTKPDIVSATIFISTLLSAATISILLWIL